NHRRETFGRELSGRREGLEQRHDRRSRTYQARPGTVHGSESERVGSETILRQLAHSRSQPRLCLQVISGRSQIIVFFLRFEVVKLLADGRRADLLIENL